MQVAPMLASIVAVLLTPGMWASENVMQQFVTNGLKVNLYKSSEESVVTVHHLNCGSGKPASHKFPGVKSTYTLVLKGKTEEEDQILWRKEYATLKQWEESLVIRDGEHIDVFDVDIGRKEGEILVLYRDRQMVYLDIVSIEGEAAQLNQAISLFHRSGDVGPPVPSGRLLVTNQGINALFDLGGGRMEVWTIAEDRTECLWTQWPRRNSGIDSQ